MGLLAGVAVLVVAITAVVTTLFLKSGQSVDSAPQPAPVVLADDPFASVPRAGADLGGDDVASFAEKLNEDSVTLAFPKFFSYRRKPGGLADGLCFVLKGREHSAVVWVVGGLKDSVTTNDLLREAGLDPTTGIARTGARPQTQRLSSVTGSGERFTIAHDPEPLEGVVLRTGYGADREVVALGVAPQRSTQLRGVIDAMLGSLRADKISGTRAVGGFTYLPRK
jgi:hypothetical protein